MLQFGAELIVLNGGLKLGNLVLLGVLHFENRLENVLDDFVIAFLVVLQVVDERSVNVFIQTPIIL